MKKLKLCRECALAPECTTRCIEALAEEQLIRSPKDTLKDKEYIAKGVPLLSYKESRKTEAKYRELNLHNDIQTL